MGRHHTLGRRTHTFSLRLHPDERAQLANLAARQGMQPADFARHRALGMELPPLPNPLSLDRSQTAAELRRIDKAVLAVFTFIAQGGQVNWNGQIEVGRELYDLVTEVRNKVLALSARTQQPG